MTNTRARVTSELSAEDRRAIESIINDAEDGFNDNDVEKSMHHFAEDAVSVNALGRVLIGVNAIGKATADGLASYLATATAFYEPFAIASVGLDVAVANKRAWSTQFDAEGGEPAEMVALYVFVRRDGRWWIARRENTVADRVD